MGEASGGGRDGKETHDPVNNTDSKGERWEGCATGTQLGADSGLRFSG